MTRCENENRQFGSGFGRWRFAVGLSVLGAVLASSGCAVPQPRGFGKLERLTETTTGRPYYLYLPKDYVEATDSQRAQRKWPLVVSFHGMKPFDTAHAQALEWEAEADRYGFVVVAPVLNAFAVLFGEFPIRTVNPAFKSDELATLAILDQVFRTTRADRQSVLSTSWSSGGYMAHYMLNRHPNVFTCLAVRQSNFSSAVLDPTVTGNSRYHPVLIVGTENDFAICKRESREAVQWYEQHEYKNLAWVNMRSLGHQRTPDTAADFFARVCGAVANGAPQALMQRQAIEGNSSGLALLAGNLTGLEKPPSETQPMPAMVAAADSPGGPTPARNVRGTPGAGDRAVGMMQGPSSAEPRREASPERQRRAADGRRAGSPLSISVSSAVGFEPLLLVYSADCPADWARTAQFYWKLNGQDIGQGINGQKTLVRPGDYTLELRAVTRDGQEHLSARGIRVLKNVEARATPQAAGH